MMEVWTQVAGWQSNDRKPMTLQVLRQLVEVLPWLYFAGGEDILFKVAFLLTFFEAVEVSMEPLCGKQALKR